MSLQQWEVNSNLSLLIDHLVAAETSLKQNTVLLIWSSEVAPCLPFTPDGVLSDILNSAVILFAGW